MDKNIISPYIRLATHSTLTAPCIINTRVLYDYEIIYVNDGTCRIRIIDKDYICKKNNVVFLRPGIPHSFHIESGAFVQPHIHFDAVYSENSKETPISFKPYEAMNEREKALIQKDIFSVSEIPFVFVPSNLTAFQSLFFDIIDSREKLLSQKAKMLRLIDMILSRFEQNESGEIKASDTAISGIKNYIDQNFHSIITLELLSGMFFINKFTLMRRFKNAYGMNIIKYYNNKRTDAAKDMLVCTNMSVRAIGEKLCFTDAYSFSRFFKASVGVSPLAFRKNSRI